MTDERAIDDPIYLIYSVKTGFERYNLFNFPTILFVLILNFLSLSHIAHIELIVALRTKQPRLNIELYSILPLIGSDYFFVFVQKFVT